MRIDRGLAGLLGFGGLGIVFVSGTFGVRASGARAESSPAAWFPQQESTTPIIEPSDVGQELFFAAAPDTPGDYVLGPEDVLEVRVFEMEQFNRTVRVSGDGTIDLPLVGPIPVQGLVPERAAQAVAGRLKEEFVHDPQVSVLVKEFNSRTLSLLGAVRNPATYALRGRRSLLQMLAEAGGVTERADDVLYVFRNTDDGRRARLIVPLQELLVRGNPRWDIWLHPSDVVSVPAKSFVAVSVLGAVNVPGNYELAEGKAFLLNALASAQGLSRRASKKGVEIRRRRSGEAQDVTIEVNVADILSGKKLDVELMSGDVVFVNEKFF